MRRWARTWLVVGLVVLGDVKFSISQEKTPEKAPPPIEIQINPLLNTKPQLQVTPNLQVREVVVNGFRTITATSPELRVEITDINGKNINLKQRRLVAGNTVTAEFKADNLAALKNKSAEAAALYEKYAMKQPAPALPPVPAGVGELAPLPPIPIEEFQASPGQRTIHLDLADRKVEITDSGDESIQVKIVRTKESKPQVEEFKADNLRQLKNLHPNAYQLYRKYTGVKLDEQE